MVAQLPAVPATLEAEAKGSLEPGSSRPSLGNIVRPSERKGRRGRSEGGEEGRERVKEEEGKKELRRTGREEASKQASCLKLGKEPSDVLGYSSAAQQWRVHRSTTWTTKELCEIRRKGTWCSHQAGNCASSYLPDWKNSSCMGHWEESL